MPKFVFRHLKNRPGEARLVEHTPANTVEIVQDGHTVPLLCQECEGQMSRWEKDFAEKFFEPFHRTPTFRAEYGAWMALFCASVVWRILSVSTENGRTVRVPSEHLVEPTMAALARWKRFLRGKDKSPGAFELHLLPLNTGGVEHHILTYADDVIETRVMGSRIRRDLFVFAKLVGFVVIGIIYDPDPRTWRHTKVFPVRGTWGGDVEFWAPDFIERYMRGAAESDVTRTREIQERFAKKQNRT